jgi:GxxExxY protein
MISSSTETDPLTHSIIGAAIEVHRHLGPGLLESAYEECLCVELGLRDIPFERQVEVPVEYKGRRIDRSFKIDVLVAGEVVVELKAVERVLPVHEAQLISYLRLSGCRTGLLMNFHSEVLHKSLMRRKI